MQKPSVLLIARLRLTTTGMAVAVCTYIDCEQNSDTSKIWVSTGPTSSPHSTNSDDNRHL